jgi:hypothetical protein
LAFENYISASIPKKAGRNSPFFLISFHNGLMIWKDTFWWIPEAGQSDLRVGGLGTGSILGLSQPLISDNSEEKYIAEISWISRPYSIIFLSPKTNSPLSMPLAYT